MPHLTSNWYLTIEWAIASQAAPSLNHLVRFGQDLTPATEELLSRCDHRPLTSALSILMVPFRGQRSSIVANARLFSPRSSQLIWILPFTLVLVFTLLTSNSYFNGLREADAAAKAKPPTDPAPATLPYVVLGYNELGMHCMNQDFSEICILPPFNTLRAQVIRRDAEPEIVTSNVDVLFSIPGNTNSNTKTNFWQYAPKLFGVNLAPNIGLTGNGLSGKMFPTRDRDWVVTGIPITPLDDKGVENPFQLSRITVSKKGKLQAYTQAVVPVSWEINCNLCHKETVDQKGKVISVATDILRKHDALHGTKLESAKPVLCAQCHADPALGALGDPDISAFSHAMHNSHADLMSELPSTVHNACYACHPGVKTECQRDVHLSKGITCVECHGDMKAVGAVNRMPWVDLPTCAECHQKLQPKFAFEEPGKLFKESRGHGGVFCAACHGPQHAVGPAVTAPDNAQAILYQGKAGVLSDCTVCHKKKPKERFFHSRDD